MSPHRAKDKRTAILNFIQNMIETQGFAPTIDEIKTGCRISTKSLVAYHLRALEINGQIVIVPYLPRGIRLPSVIES